MLDAGDSVPRPNVTASLYTLRTCEDQQWHLLLGSDLEALRGEQDDSPKLRVPGLARLFAGFSEEYRLTSEHFRAVGALAPGGLSNAWGAGVASFDARDLGGSPIPLSELQVSYRHVAARIGISGSADDDLGEFFGCDLPLQPPVALDSLTRRLYDRYKQKPRPSVRGEQVRLGIARNAVLSRPHAGRFGCNHCALCLYGCSRRAIYNAAFDLDALRARPGFVYQPDVFVENVVPADTGYRLNCRGRSNGQRFSFEAKRVILACGAIGTAKLVLQALRVFDHPVRLHSQPAVAFALWFPSQLGRATPQESFGLAQLSFMVEDLGETGEYVSGNIFSAALLPLREFVQRAPLSRLTARRALRLMAPSMLVANCFLSGALSDHQLTVRVDGTVHLRGAYRPEVRSRLVGLRTRLSRFFRRCGGIVVPGSFTLLSPGADIHYTGTVPHSLSPKRFQCHANGEVAGLPGVYVVDGAALGRLPAKPHTFTIMANADRISRKLAERWHAENLD